MAAKRIPSGASVAPITIKTNFDVAGTEIWVSDQKMSHVTSVTFRHRAGELPTLELEMLAEGVTVDAEAVVSAGVLCPACKKKMEEHSQIAQRNIEIVEAFRASALAVE